MNESGKGCCGVVGVGGNAAEIQSALSALPEETGAGDGVSGDLASLDVISDVISPEVSCEVPCGVE